MLSIRDLNHYYGESHTLRQLSLEVPAGACTCVMGRNGVGKTTLMKCIMGEEVPRNGHIRLGDSLELIRQAPEDRARLGIGYVPQGRQIFPLLTVEENLKTGLGAVREDREGRLDEVYALFPVLEEMKHRLGGDLSGGQQQQLAIGRALVLRPRVLILDEPGEGIQPNIVRQIGELIRTLIESRGLTVLLVEQKLPFARRFADHFALMDRGQVQEAGPMDTLTDELVRRFLSV
ncbi:MAG: urea ABC transporter ATP-binding subunit UrtE [Gammaproteobacteria bacterium]|nr:MAG: urea ABC transporter ATP-binding subunit UrtE [Gammaproteobacteria bacterium]